MIEIQQTAQNIKLIGSLTRFDNIGSLSLPVNDKNINVDLMELTIDTAGLAWLLQQKLVLAAQSVVIAWQNVPQDLSNLARISDVNHILEIE